MSPEHTYSRPLTIAILALGGQGGGVLTRWLVDTAQAHGFLAQSTYVAGVAQRTGATVYCIEMFPKPPHDGDPLPIFSPYPVPGDVDLVVVGEMAELGRALHKGFVTPNLTQVVVSQHRVYSIGEKSALGNGMIDQRPVLKAAREAARGLIAFDMQALAEETGSVISAVLLGAIAASGALPFTKEAFENTIRRSGRDVEPNLEGFARGFGHAESPAETQPEPDLEWPAATGPIGAALLERISAEYPEPVRNYAAHGALRTLTYQDAEYAELYLKRLHRVLEQDSALGGHNQGWALTRQVARQLALQMCYEDVIRVAEIKTSARRFDALREQLNVTPDQPLHVVEYVHPRLEEMCDLLPGALARLVQNSQHLQSLLRPFFKSGRHINTTHLAGFMLLSSLASLKRWRRKTSRYPIQQKFIENWLEQLTIHSGDYPLALALAECIGLVRGYGETYERGLDRYQRSVSAVHSLATAERATALRKLIDAALENEQGAPFEQQLTLLGTATP